MIKFFCKTRYNLIRYNKTRKYFKYANGEIVLVVISVLKQMFKSKNEFFPSLKRSITNHQFPSLEEINTNYHFPSLEEINTNYYFLSMKRIKTIYHFPNIEEINTNTNVLRKAGLPPLDMPKIDP